MDCSDGNAEHGETEVLPVCDMIAWVVKDEQSSVVRVFEVVNFDMFLMAELLQAKRLAT